MTVSGTRGLSLSDPTGRSGTLAVGLGALAETESFPSTPATASRAAAIAAAPIGIRLALRHPFSVVFPSLGAPAIGAPAIGAPAIGGFAFRFSDSGAATRSGSSSSIHSPVTPSSPPDLQMRSLSRSASAAALARPEVDSRLASRSRRRE
jgi:hypothetical protein